jgi:hypothetical protein
VSKKKARESTQLFLMAVVLILVGGIGMLGWDPHKVTIDATWLIALGAIGLGWFWGLACLIIGLVLRAEGD